LQFFKLPSANKVAKVAMEIFILINYTDKKILKVSLDFSEVSEELNRYMNNNGFEALIPGLLLEEVKSKKQVEVKAGSQLLAIAVNRPTIN
jgi:hypothetical protein